MTRPVRCGPAGAMTMVSKGWRPTIGGGVLAISALTAAASGWARMQADTPVTVAAPVGADAADAPPAMLGQFCARCHNDVDKVAGLSIDDLRGRDSAIASRRMCKRWWAGSWPSRRSPRGRGDRRTVWCWHRPDASRSASLSHRSPTAGWSLDGCGITSSASPG